MVPVPEYRGVPGRTDEYLGPTGRCGTRWKQVAAEMAGLGPSGLIARRSEVARLLRNEGATYNVTRDNQSRRQAWSLDPWPLVLEEAEWSALESAVAQRVRLLDLVFADLYGDAPAGGGRARPRRAGARPPGVPAGVRRHGVPRAPTAVPHRRRRGPGRLAASSGPSATGPRPPRDSGTPWSTGPSCPGSSPTSTGSRGWSGWPGSSGPSGPAWPARLPRGSTSPGWSSSPRAR